MSRKIAAGSALLLGMTLVLPVGATAVVDARTTVTIKAEGTDLSAGRSRSLAAAPTSARSS